MEAEMIQEDLFGQLYWMIEKEEVKEVKEEEERRQKETLF